MAERKNSELREQIIKAFRKEIKGSVHTQRWDFQEVGGVVGVGDSANMLQ